MIKKERKVPSKIRKLEALLRRLPPSHPKYREIEGELAKSRAGYKGEQSLDYYLSFLPQQEVFIFHDLRLPHNNYFFQVDTLIVTPSFILILEVKHIAGTLLFDHGFHQLIRTLNGTEDVFPDPILQVHRQATQLAAWLEQHKYPQIPIESLVVITHSATLLKSTPIHSNRIQSVIRSDNLHEKFQALQYLHRDNKLSKKDLRKLSSLLLKANTPPKLDILQQFHITYSELVKGVYCPACHVQPMERIFGKWQCLQCGSTSKYAHVAALQDYALLVKPSITNRECREFLQVSSITIAKKLLAAMDMPYTGTTKARAYRLVMDE